MERRLDLHDERRGSAAFRVSGSGGNGGDQCRRPPVPREPFGFGGWNESRFGVGDITGATPFSFGPRLRKTTVKWTSRQTNWMS